jgi:hypothetical protein
MKVNRTLILNTLLIVILLVSCKKEDNTPPTPTPTPTIVIPTVTTTAISAITTSSAISGGAITSDGGNTISAWGVCWSTSASPTLANSFLQNNEISGGFSSILIGLTPNTTYYVRAYATNSAGTAYGNERSFTTTASLTIGQSYQGGKIAYIDASGLHGLIVAPSDQSTGASWGCSSTEISGAGGTAFGTGNQNTINIINGCSTAGIAARLCGDLVLGGYSDWYLPSQYELSYLYQNRVAFGGSPNGGFAYDKYWSSTQTFSAYAVYVNFAGGSALSQIKDYPFYVRAVRSF